MTLGFAIGIIGIVFGAQIDNFLDADRKRNPNLIEQHVSKTNIIVIVDLDFCSHFFFQYFDEKFLLLMNGSLTLLMSLTLVRHRSLNYGIDDNDHSFRLLA